MKNKHFIIQENLTIKDAWKKIEKNKSNIIFVQNFKKNIIASLTDGDIRRALLNGFNLNSNINQVYNNDFNYLRLSDNFSSVCEKFKNKSIDFLPILNNKKEFVNYITKKQFHIVLLQDINFNLKDKFSKYDDHILEHEIYNRPWGFYKSTLLSTYVQSKIITVFPGEQLSLQEHKKREEHWIIIKGSAKMILGESIIDIHPGKYIFIPKGCKHQIINTSNENIIFSEVQLGSYFGEDDIIRFEDKYGRI